MLKEAMEYLIGVSAPHYKEIDGKVFSDRRMEPVYDNSMPKILDFNTLDGLLDYVSTADELTGRELFIHVENPGAVCVYGMLDRNCKRYYFARASALVPQQSFGEYMGQEDFGIYLRTHFVHDEIVDKLLAFSGTVTGDDIQVLVDDGVSQQVTVRSMVQGNQSAIAPNECFLRPYRTFYEITQPASPFVFRCKKCGDSIGFALFEADGGMWKYEAMGLLKKYIMKNFSIEGRLSGDRDVKFMM